NYLRTLYEDKVNGVINAEQFKELITNYNNDEDVYRNQIKSIDNEIAFYKMKEEVSNNNNELFKKYQQLKELTRVTIEEFVEKIYIGALNEETNTRNIKIKWNFE
ncbi:MAG: DUF4368 domain-containing protein, partial [Bacilli bacterium]|nr:DUF4368 domain-containing protein [Bacilli bacterium]